MRMAHRAAAGPALSLDGPRPRRVSAVPRTVRSARRSRETTKAGSCSTRRRIKEDCAGRGCKVAPTRHREERPSVRVFTKGRYTSLRPLASVSAYTGRRGNLTRGTTMTSRTGITGSFNPVSRPGPSPERAHPRARGRLGYHHAQGAPSMYVPLPSFRKRPGLEQVRLRWMVNRLEC